MDKNKQIEKFYNDLKAQNHMDKCSFLIEWFNAKVKELNAIPEQYDRSGIQKGERIPIPRAKYTLALHVVVFPKLPLKKFCALRDINYGTARNWRNTDDIFTNIKIEFEKEYSQAFLKRYAELVAITGKRGFAEALQLIEETRYYSRDLTRLNINPGLSRFGIKNLIHPQDGVPFSVDPDSIDLDSPDRKKLRERYKMHLTLRNAFALIELDKSRASVGEAVEKLFKREMDQLVTFIDELKKSYDSPQVKLDLSKIEDKVGDSFLLLKEIFKKSINAGE